MIGICHWFKIRVRHDKNRYQKQARSLILLISVVAIALSAQIVDEGIIPLETHDFKPDVLITPIGIF